MVSIGIDVAKGKSMVCAMKPYGEVVIPPKEISHLESDVKSFIASMKAITEEVRIIMESTGAYHLPLLQSFQQAGLFVYVVNPLIMRKYASVTLRKAKTDKIDAIKIANYGLEQWHSLQEYQPREATYAELKTLGRQYYFYLKMRVDTLNNLTDLLDQTMPNIKSLLQNTNAKKTKSKLCDFVSAFWHYDCITAMSEKRFCTAYARWAKKEGYRPDETKAKAIFALAKSGIPTMPSEVPSTKMLVLESVRVLTEVDQTLSVILARMQELANTLPEYPVVLDMKGVGETLGPRLIAEIGDVRRFHSGSALVAFAGIDAPPFQSGTFTGTNRRISKRGSALLRKTGYEIMKMLKARKPTEDNAVYLFMLKKEAEGKHKKLAKMAGLNKFLRIYYARVCEVYSNAA